MTTLRKLRSTECLCFYSLDTTTSFALPLFSSLIPAGFPSPADDYLELRLDLNRHLITHPSATFCARVTGNSMTEAGIQEGDILIIDKALAPTDGNIVVCFLDGAFTVKRIEKQQDHLYLMPANEQYAPILHCPQQRG